MQISWEKRYFTYTQKLTVHEDYYNSLLPLNKGKKLNERPLETVNFVNELCSFYSVVDR